MVYQSLNTLLQGAKTVVACTVYTDVVVMFVGLFVLFKLTTIVGNIRKRALLQHVSNTLDNGRLRDS